MPDLTPLIVTVPIAATIAGYAALRMITLLTGQIGGKDTKRYRDAQKTSRKAFGSGYAAPTCHGSNKGGPPSGE